MHIIISFDCVKFELKWNKSIAFSKKLRSCNWKWKLMAIYCSRLWCVICKCAKLRRYRKADSVVWFRMYSSVKVLPIDNVFLLFLRIITSSGPRDFWAVLWKKLSFSVEPYLFLFFIGAQFHVKLAKNVKLFYDFFGIKN